MRNPIIALVLLAATSAPATEFVTRGGDGALWVVDSAGHGTSAGGQILGRPDAAWDSALRVVVRGTDDALWTTTRSGGAWSAFERVGGTVSGAPSCVARDGGLDVVARGSDGACWHVRRDASGWGSWETLGGSFPERATFGLASRDASSLDVFARGMDGEAWHAQLGPSGWTGFEPLGGAIGSDPDACSPAPDRIDVVAVGTDSKAMIRTWRLASGWSPWASLEGSFLAGTSLAIASGEGHLVVAGIGTDERIWSNELASDRWSGWHRIGDGKPASSAVSMIVPSAGAAPPIPIAPVAMTPPPAAPTPLGHSEPRELPTAVEARALLDIDPSTLVRFDRPRAATSSVSLSPDALARLTRASDEPFPGCGSGAPCVRVTLLGFRLDGATNDPAGDGPGDEIAVRADAWFSPDGSSRNAEPFVRETKVHGSRPAGATGPAARRVKAGSASADGGFQRGDRHPARMSLLDSPGAPGELPLVLFEGPLDGSAELRLVLTAWEMDEGQGPAACCSSWNADVLSSAFWPSSAPLWTGGVQLTRPEAEREQHDRPYGRLENLAAGHVLGGTIAQWRALAARSSLAGPGVLTLEHGDFDGTARCITFVRVTVTE